MLNNALDFAVFADDSAVTERILRYSGNYGCGSAAGNMLVKHRFECFGCDERSISAQSHNNTRLSFKTLHSLYYGMPCTELFMLIRIMCAVSEIIAYVLCLMTDYNYIFLSSCTLRRIKHALHDCSSAYTLKRLCGF